MNVNGVTSATEAYSNYKSSYKKTETKEPKNEKPETGVVYEVSDEAKKMMEAENADKVTATKTNEKNAQKTTDNQALIAKLQADADAQVAQLKSLVEKLMLGQASGDKTDIWSFLRSGDFTVDAETKAAAEEAISEDGYFGVEQTSDRIIEFAKALTGGDMSKMGSMLDAFKKGYEQAEKTWGGKLPEISQKTYDAVVDKFNKLMEDAE